MKSLQERRDGAKERQEEYNSLTTVQKILKLDIRFGDGKGAVKERAKLALQLIKESEGRVPKVSEEIVLGQGAQRIPKKAYQKPKKS